MSIVAGASPGTKKQLRILISAWGSRGDMQPYVAAALGMMAVGHRASIMSKLDLKEFVEGNGVDFIGFEMPVMSDGAAEGVAAPSNNVEQQGGDLFLKAKKDVAKMFDEGCSFSYCLQNIASIFHSKAETVKERNVWLLKLMEMCKEEWDLLCVGTMTDVMGLALSLNCGVPCVLIQLQQWDPQPAFWLGGHERGKDGVQTPVEAKAAIDAGFAHLTRMTAESFPAPCDNLLKVLGDPSHWYNDWRWNKFPCLPAVCAVTQLQAEILYPTLVKEGKLQFIGSLFVPEEKQTPQTDDKECAGFGKASDLDELQVFIELDKARRPIYMGWGSMVPFISDTKKAMLLVMQALKISDQRAIILAGYLKLSMELLREAVGENDEKGLVAYAEANVMFKEKVPHEWLMKKVACTVHHGGAGTLNAAMRAGKPTVVMPIHPGDQFDHAHLVNELGCGVSFPSKHFTQISAQELGDAIRRCVIDDAIQRRANEVQKYITEQSDGAEKLVEFLEQFHTQQVATGNWQSAVDEMKRNALLTPCNP